MVQAAKLKAFKGRKGKATNIVQTITSKQKRNKLKIDEVDDIKTKEILIDDSDDDVILNESDTINISSEENDSDDSDIQQKDFDISDKDLDTETDDNETSNDDLDLESDEDDLSDEDLDVESNDNDALSDTDIESDDEFSNENDVSTHNNGSKVTIGKKRKMLQKNVKQSKIPKVSKENSENVFDKVTVFHENIAFEVTKDDLKELFKKSTGGRIVRGNVAATCRSFNFVKLASMKDLENSFQTKAKHRSSIRITKDKLIQAKSSTLLIKGITQNISKEAFAEKFEGVRGVRVFKDLKSGKYSGFGHVEFESLALAEEAYKSTKNGIIIDSMPLQVKYASNKGKPNLMKKDTLYIRGLSDDVDEDAINEKFQGIIDTDLVKDSETGRNKGFCYLKFESNEMADKAYKVITDGLSIKGQKLKVDYAMSRDILCDKKPDTLYVGGITSDMEEDDLLKALKGAVDVQIIRHRKTKRCAGYCFVKFESDETADEAFQSTRDGLTVDGRRLEVKFSFNKNKSVPVNRDTLFIKPIPDDLTEDAILKQIEGAIDVRISKNCKTGETKRFCFVEFKSEEMAESALKSMENGELKVDGKVLRAYYAKTRDNGRGDRRTFSSKQKRRRLVTFDDVATPDSQ